MLFTLFDWKTSKWAHYLLHFFISYWEKLLKLIKFIIQSYLLPFEFVFILKHIFCLRQWFFLDGLPFEFVFILKHIFCLSLIFFRWLAYKSLLSRFSVLINYVMWSDNLFSLSSCFPCFSWSSLFAVRIFRFQVFQGLSPGSGSKF